MNIDADYEQKEDVRFIENANFWWIDNMLTNCSLIFWDIRYIIFLIAINISGKMKAFCPKRNRFRRNPDEKSNFIKFLVLVLAFSMTVSLFACDNDQPEETSANESQTVTALGEARLRSHRRAERRTFNGTDG